MPHSDIHGKWFLLSPIAPSNQVCAACQMEFLEISLDKSISMQILGPARISSTRVPRKWIKVGQLLLGALGYLD